MIKKTQIKVIQETICHPFATINNQKTVTAVVKDTGRLTMLFMVVRMYNMKQS